MIKFACNKSAECKNTECGIRIPHEHWNNMPVLGCNYGIHNNAVCERIDNNNKDAIKDIDDVLRRCE